jgi:hypothetical protein
LTGALRLLRRHGFRATARDAGVVELTRDLAPAGARRP